MVPLRMLVFGAGTSADKSNVEGHEEYAGIEFLTKNGQIMREKCANELILEADPDSKIGK